MEKLTWAGRVILTFRWMKRPSFVHLVKQSDAKDSAMPFDWLKAQIPRPISIMIATTRNMTRKRVLSWFDYPRVVIVGCGLRGRAKMAVWKRL